MPEGNPGSVLSLEAYPQGSSAIHLVWEKPVEPNGLLLGYKIYYQVVNGSKTDPKVERVPHISDPDAKSAKLAGLAPETKYRIHIQAFNGAGEGNK